MASQFHNGARHDTSGSGIHAWIAEYYDKSGFQGDDEVSVLSMSGELVKMPRSKCCIVFREFEGHERGGWRATPVGLFVMRDAMVAAFTGGNTYIKALDVCIPLGDPDYTNGKTLDVLRQCARQWVSGSRNDIALDLTHVPTMLFSAIQCVTYRMKGMPILMPAFAGLLRSLTLGCQRLPVFAKIASTLATAGNGIGDMTQRAISRKLTVPPTPFDRESQLNDLCTMLRRHSKKNKGEDNVEAAPGIVGIFLLVEAEAQRIVDTVLEPLDSRRVEAGRARFTARCDALRAETGAEGPLRALVSMMDMCGTPLSETSAKALLDWMRTTGRNPKASPPLEAMGLIPPKAKIEWLMTEEYRVVKNDAHAKMATIVPLTELKATAKLQSIPDWGGVQLLQEGVYTVTPRVQGLSEAGVGNTKGAAQTANLRITSGDTFTKANIMCQLVDPECSMSYSSAGMLVEPAEIGTSGKPLTWKYTNLAKADPTAAFGLSAPFRIHYDRRAMVMRIERDGRTYTTLRLNSADHRPILAFKFLEVDIALESIEVAVKAVSWAEAVAAAEAKAP